MTKKVVICFMGVIIWWAGNSLFVPEYAFAEQKCFGGIGIEITKTNEKVSVVSIIEGSPSQKSRLQPNDEIIAIDAESTHGKSLLYIVRKLRGEVGAPVVLSVYRPSDYSSFDEEIVREEICVEAVNKN